MAFLHCFQAKINKEALLGKVIGAVMGKKDENVVDITTTVDLLPVFWEAEKVRTRQISNPPANAKSKTAIVKYHHPTGGLEEVQRDFLRYCCFIPISALFSVPLVLQVHQNYYAKNPLSPYCVMNVGTKLAKVGPDISRINRLTKEREQQSATTA